MKKEDIPAVIDYILGLDKHLKDKGYCLEKKLFGRIHFELRLEGGHKISFSIEPITEGDNK